MKIYININKEFINQIKAHNYFYIVILTCSDNCFKKNKDIDMLTPLNDMYIFPYILDIKGNMYMSFKGVNMSISLNDMYIFPYILDIKGGNL